MLDRQAGLAEHTLARSSAHGLQKNHVECRHPFDFADAENGP